MVTTSQQLGIDYTKTYLPVSATAPEIPGLPFAAGETSISAADGTEWVFVLAGSAIAVGDVCVIQTIATWSTVPITITLAKFGKMVAVAETAIASASYGWVKRKGLTSGVKVKASALPFAQLCATATAGRLDDAVTTGYIYLKGIVINSTQAATVGTLAGTLNYPIVDTTRPATI